MRVAEAEDSVYEGLRELAWRPYLAAMWILCGELRALYADELIDIEEALIASTMDIVRKVAMAGESDDSGNRAKELAEEWGQLRTAREDAASSGLTNVWSTCEGLVQEIGKITPQFDGAEWVTNAVSMRWEDPNHEGPIWINPDEEIDDASPKAQSLMLFKRIVDETAKSQRSDWDPIRLRADIFP